MSSATFILDPTKDIHANINREWRNCYKQWWLKNFVKLDGRAGMVEFAEQTATESFVSLADLTSFRGGYKRIKPSRGGAVGFLSNASKITEYAIGYLIVDADELTVLQEIARVYGGEYVGIWTYGQSLQMIFLRSKKPGVRPDSLRISLRLKRPADFLRNVEIWNAISDWFLQSAWKPDLNNLKREYDSQNISVSSWFSAFGIDGANDLQPTDANEIWNAFEQVAQSLLEQRDIDKRKLKQVNDVTKNGERLPAKAKKSGNGTTARAIAGVDAALREVMGDPASSTWKSRHKAARLYSAIADGPAQERLALGVDKKGLGISAAMVKPVLAELAISFTPMAVSFFERTRGSADRA